YDALDGRLQARDPFGGLDRRQQALPVRRLKISHARYHSKGKSKKAKGNRRGEPCVKLTPCKCRAAQGIIFTFAFCLFTLPSFDARVTCAVPYSRIFLPETSARRRAVSNVAALWNSDR